jgi:cytochrome c-type biogenesis protein CcmH/NrfG
MGGETISPLAATAPLPDRGVTTGALDAGDPHFSTPPPAAASAHERAAYPTPAQTSVDSGEITIPVVRAAQQATGVLSTGVGAESGPPPATTTSKPLKAAAPPATERRALRVWAVSAAIIAVLLVCVVGALWLALSARRAPASVNVDAPAAVPMDARQQAQTKFAEAQGLLAAGNPIGATARLREALALDPTNAEAHRQLAQLLLESGARQTAIEELRAVTRLEPNDKDAWRQLAEAQFAEGAYTDAADSYHMLLAVSNEAATDDRLQLAYADALRLAGRTDGARALYRRLATSPLADVAHASKQRLTDLSALPADENASAATREDAPNKADNALPGLANANRAPAAAAPEHLPASAPAAANASARTPAEHYERGVSLWAANRAAALAEFRTAAGAGNADAYYYLGLSLAEGRDPHTLNRAELVAALEYFQRARAGRFGAQSRRYEDQLGQEFDRRRKQ